MIVKEYARGAIIYLENQTEYLSSSKLIDKYIERYNLNEEEIFRFTDRLVITPEDESYVAEAMTKKLLNEKTYIEIIEESFDISDSFCFINKKVGDIIDNGYMKLINILLFLNKDKKTKKLITLSHCNIKFHPVLAIELIRIITKMSNKAVFSTANKFIFDAITKKIDKGVIK